MSDGAWGNTDERRRLEAVDARAEEQLSHPPTPPGSDTVIQDVCDDLENAWWDNLGGLTPDNEGILRQLQANWYRCAWLDEAQRLESNLPCASAEDFEARCTAVGWAKSQAEAWRLWGDRT